MIKLETGLVFDQSMAEHRCLWDENYPECPERFTRILERCENLGLIKRCKLIEPRLATHDELILKHTQFQIDILKATDECTDINKLEKISSRYDAIYIHPVSFTFINYILISQELCQICLILLYNFILIFI